MNSPFRVAQVSPTNSQPTRVVTITKPSNGEAVVVNLSHDGKVKLDLSAIANEKITIVKVPSGEPGGAEKAIILFDNQSTITIDPFFFSGQFPLNLTVDLNAQQHDLTPTDFASIFPVTDDQSILPAGGNGGPAAGADFSNPSVDPLAPSNPLPLLGPEELPNWTRTTEVVNDFTNDTPTFDAGQSFELDEDSLTNPPALRAGNNDNALGDDPGGQSFSGSLHYDFKHDGPAATDPIMVDVGALNALNLTSGGQTITFVWDPATFTLTGVINQGQPNETAIIKLQIDPGTATSAGNDHPFTLELLGPLDHPGHDDPSTPGVETSFEDNIVLHLDFTITDSNGTATPGVVDINIDDDSPVLTHEPAVKLTVEENDIATPWSLGTSPNTNPEFPGDQSVTQGGGGLVHPAVVTGSVAGLVAFGADGEKNFGFSADTIAYFKSLNLFSKQTASPENGISLDYSITQDVANHTITLHAYEPDTPGPGVTGNPVFDFVLDTQTGDFQFKLYDELIHTPGNGENTDLRSGGPGYYDAGNDGFAEAFLDAANAPAAGSVPYLDFGHIITATDGDGDTITLDGQVQISVKDDIPQTHISVNPFGIVQHDESAGVQGPTFADPADSDTSSSAVRNLFSSLETNHAGELGNDPDVAHTPSGGPAIGYAHSALPVVINSTVNYGADFPPESAVFSLQTTDGTYSGVKTTDGHNIYLYNVDGYIVGRVSGDGVPGSSGDANDHGQIAFAITIEQGGNIDVAQYLSLQHPNTASNDETISLNDSAIQAQLVVTDSDGDAVPAVADIGSHIRFDDDGPKLVGRSDAYTADEDDILDLQSVGSHPNDGNSDGSFTGAPIDNIAGPAYLSGNLANFVDFGADGPGGFKFSGDTISTLQNLSLSSKGVDLSYTMVGNTLVAYVEQFGSGYNPLADRTVFTLSLDSNGQFEFKLYDQLDHVYGNNGENTQLAGTGTINGLNFGSLILATDGDGDSIAMNGKLTIKITDDVPHIVSFKETGAGVTIDESGGIFNDNNTILSAIANQFASLAGSVGHDPDMGPVYAFNILPVVTGVSLPGADEPATSVLTLQVSAGGYSGLQTTDGHNIYLYSVGDFVVGRVGGTGTPGSPGDANAQGDIAFAITINQLGQLSVAQYLSLHHDNPNNPDDTKTLADNLLQVKLTVTDFDGDQDTRVLDIGSVVHFDDDGPKVGGNAEVKLDEDALNGNVGGPGDYHPGDNGPILVNGTLSHDYGADGEGATTLLLDSGAPSGFKYTLDATGKILTISQLQDGNYVDVIKVTLSDTSSGNYTVEQVHAIDHAPPSGNPPVANENNLSLNIGYRVTDGDGDHADGTLKITVNDDSPTVTTATVSGYVDEDALSNHDVDGVPLRPGEVDGPALGWSAVSTGSLGALFNPGADTPLHYSMLNSSAAINTLISQNLKSDGVALSYSVSGDTLTAYIEAGGGSGYQSGQDTPVFTLQIATDGTYTFTLLNELDHPKLDGQGNGNNENTLTINFGGLVHAADHDGDPVNASGPAVFNITVLDDMPSIALGGGNLIVDGDFAGGPGDFPLHVNEWQPGSGADTDGIPGWTVTASPVNPAGFVELERVGDGYLGMHTSTHGAMIDMAASPGNIAIAQTVTGAAGQTYAIQFEAGAPFPTTAELQVYWGGQLIGTIDPNGPMTSYNYVVTANGGPQTLEFREVGDVTSPTPGAADGGYHGTYLANVAMIPVSIVDEDGLPNGNHDLPAPSIGDAQVPNTDGDNNEATTTGSLNITWGVDDTNGGIDGIAADSGFIQDGANGAALTGRSVYFTDASVGVSGGIPLTSHGDAVTFVLSQNNTVLTGMAGGREIFSVSLSDDGSGAYRFILKGQLDHAPNGDENDITLTFNFTAKDFDGDAVSGHFAVGVDDDVPVLTVGAGDHPQTIALALDETVQPDNASNPGYDRYNGAETESAPGASNGGGDDVAAGAGPVYNHTPVISLNPAESQAIGSLTTAAGVIGSQFGVHVSYGADGPAAGGGLSQHLGFVLSSASVATNLVATNTGAPELAGFVSDASRAISLVKVSDTVIEGRIVGDPNNANDDYVAFRLTLNNASDPANASITVDQFMAIQQDDHTRFDENTILKLAQGSLDLKLDVVATDGDQDSTPVQSFTVNLANGAGSMVSFDDDGPVVKSVTPTVGPNLVMNGSFEDGHTDIGSSDWNIYSSLPGGWTTGPDHIPFEVQTGGVGGLGAEDQNALIELDGDTEGNPAHTPQGTPDPNGHTNATIQQVIAGTEAGHTYELSFWYAPRPGDGTNSSGLQVSFEGNVVYTIPATPNPPSGWQLITLDVTASGPNSVLAFTGTGSENEFGALLDNVSLHAVTILDDEQTNSLGIAGGPGDDGYGVVATGKINFDPGTDGLKSIELHGVDNLKAIYVDANGVGHPEDVSFQWTANGAGGTLLGTMNTPDGVKNVLTVTVDASGNYTLTLLAPLDHPGHDNPNTPATETSFEDNLDLGIGFTITDGDGDTAAGTLHFNVDDDSPVANNDTDTIGASSAHVLNFDDLVLGDAQESPITAFGASYGGLVFTQTGIYNPPGTGPYSTYTPTSGNNVAFIGEKLPGADIPGYTGNAGDPITIAKDGGGLFTPRSAEFSSNSGDPLQIVITGYDSANNVVGTINATIHQGSATLVDFSSLGSIDHMTIDSVPGGTSGLFFGFDDFTYWDPATGNVLTGAGTNEGTANADHTGADGGKITAVAGFGGSSDNSADASHNFQVNGQFGKLTINEDGSYVYTRTSIAGGSDQFTYTLTDGDGDSVTATLTINLDTLNSLPSAFNPTVVADEDDLTTATADFNGNHDTAPGDDNPSGLTGSLGNFGGDGPGSISFGSLNGLAVRNTSNADVKSGGVLLHYFWDGASTLYASKDITNSTTAINTAVFKVVVDETTGGYTFTLLNHIDHPGSIEDNQFIDLPFVVTDSNSDTANGVLHVNIDDDMPVALAGNYTAGEVYEDGLKTPGNLSNGNAEPPALQPVSVLVTSAALANFVSAGADGLKSFGLNANVSGTVHTSTGADLKSDGVVVTYAIDNGTGDILGMAGNREVFRLHDNGNGTFSFTLNDQIDHIPNVPADNDSQTLDINIVSAFTATDGDGDTVPLNLGSLNITVEDDIPFFAGDPYTLAVTHTDTVYSGSVDFHVGADEPGQFSITPPTISGVTTQTSTDAQTGIVTITGTFTGSGDPYYVFTFNPSTGGYTFDLENLPTTVTPLANVSTQGAFAPVQQKDFGDFTFIADAGHTINGSNQGTGVGDDNLEGGEHLTVAFDTPRTVADFGLNFVGSGTLTIAWKAIDTATGNYETGTALVTADGTLSINVLSHVQPADADPLSNDIAHFDKLELTATGPNSAKVKITSVGGSEVTEDHNPGPFVFNVTGSDFDGDKDSTTITVNTNIAPAIPEPLGGDANTNILYQQIMIPLAALLGHDGITPDTGITVTNVVGATVSGDFVVLPGAAPGTDTTFSYAFTDGTTTTDSASMTIHRVDQFLNGTSGKDFFIARDWGETVNGGADNDLIIKAGATLNGGDGNDYLFGTGGNNVISGNGGDDYIVGYGGSNTLSGGDGNDFLAGHGGTNILTGGAGNDVLYAASTPGHNSSLDGGADNDTLYAGHYNGTTTLKGGTGNDTFVFLDYTIAPNPTAGAASTITDYTFGQDKVDLTGLLDSIYGQGNATAGDVRLAVDPNNSSNAVVQVDVNTGAGQTWQSVVSLTGYNHAGNQVDVVLDHMTNQQHTYTV